MTYVDPDHIPDTEPCLNLSHLTPDRIAVYCGHGMEDHDTDEGDCIADGCECLRYRTDGAQD